MAKRGVLGLFPEATAVAEAVSLLQRAGFRPSEYDVLSGVPYPEGAFGEAAPSHRLFVFPFVGAALGASVAVLLTIGTQISYPLVTGGKPILSIPPMTIITYEGMMLGAIIFTVLGVLFESRLPRPRLGIYDSRITEGYLGVSVYCDEERLGQAENALRQAGAAEIKLEAPRR